MQLYLLYPYISSAILRLNSKKLEWTTILILFIISVSYSFGWSFFSEAFLANPSLASLYKRILLAGIFYFVLGIYLGMNYHSYMEKIYDDHSFLIWTLFSGVMLLDVFWSIFGVGTNQSGLSNILFGLIGNVIGTIVIVLGFFVLFFLARTSLQKRSKVGRAIKSLGEYSFGMYLFFILFVDLFSIIVFKIDMNKADWTYFPLFYLLVLVSSFVATFLLSYLPYSRLLVGDNPKSRRKSIKAVESQTTIENPPE